MAQEERIKARWKAWAGKGLPDTEPCSGLPYALFVSCNGACLPVSEILDIPLG